MEARAGLPRGVELRTGKETDGGRRTGVSPEGRRVWRTAAARGGHGARVGASRRTARRAPAPPGPARSRATASRGRPRARRRAGTAPGPRGRRRGARGRSPPSTSTGSARGSRGCGGGSRGPRGRASRRSPCFPSRPPRAKTPPREVSGAPCSGCTENACSIFPSALEGGLRLFHFRLACYLAACVGKSSVTARRNKLLMCQSHAENLHS